MRPFAWAESDLTGALLRTGHSDTQRDGGSAQAERLPGEDAGSSGPLQVEGDTKPALTPIWDSRPSRTEQTEQNSPLSEPRRVHSSPSRRTLKYFSECGPWSTSIRKWTVAENAAPGAPGKVRSIKAPEPRELQLPPKHPWPFQGPLRSGHARSQDVLRSPGW